MPAAGPRQHLIIEGLKEWCPGSVCKYHIPTASIRVLTIPGRPLGCTAEEKQNSPAVMGRTQFLASRAERLGEMEVCDVRYGGQIISVPFQANHILWCLAFYRQPASYGVISWDPELSTCGRRLETNYWQYGFCVPHICVMKEAVAQQCVRHHLLAATIARLWIGRHLPGCHLLWFDPFTARDCLGD